MKSRSIRLASSEPPPDDWINGSWTVDCICGVTFDDGEEMVNCDDCGVWVHTRCSRFVRGDKSFACDKCKSKPKPKPRPKPSRIHYDDPEETEVAQLLVELPTKTIHLNHHHIPTASNSNLIISNIDKYDDPIPYPPPPPLPPRRPRPYKLWTDRPLEDRVHVQGLPAGDPSLFPDLPSIFTPQLWKSTGYVPKKFNFCYREFPCWDDVDAKAQADTENVASKGAGVLYSLSKQTVVSITGHVKPAASDKRTSRDKKGDAAAHFDNLALSRKDKPRPFVLQSGKRTREDLGSCKDRSAKKKSKTLHKDHNNKRDKPHTHKPVVIYSPNATHVETNESKAKKVPKPDTQYDKHGYGSQEFASNSHPDTGILLDESKRNAASVEGNLTPRPCEASGMGQPSDKRVKLEKLPFDASNQVQKPANTEELLSLSPVKDSVARNPVKKEVSDDICRNQGVHSETPTILLPKSQPLIKDMAYDALKDQDTEIFKNLEISTLLSSAVCDSKTNLDASGDNQENILGNHFSEIVAKSHSVKYFSEQGLSVDPGPAISNIRQSLPSSPPSLEHDRDGEKGLEATDGCQSVRDDKITESPCNNELQCESPECLMKLPKIPRVAKEVLRGPGETAKSIGTVPPSLPSQRKMVSAMKVSSSSSSIVMSKSSLSDKNRSGRSQNPCSIGKRTLSSSTTSMKKEVVSVDPAKDEDKHESRKSVVKDKPKSSLTSAPKASLTSRANSSPVLKHCTSVVKDSSRHTSSKSSSVESSLQASGAGEQQRGERNSPSNLQSSSKGTTFCLLPGSSNSPAGLSDEEYALLLHQQLNSSPRVPRFPRVRHTGSLPQSSTSSATSILNKRTSNSGGKDQHTFSRRKSKDLHKDGSHSSHEHSNEARKSHPVPSSPDSAKVSGVLNHAETSSEPLHSMRKNVEQISSPTPNTGPHFTDTTGLKFSSNEGSPANNPEDDTPNDKGLGSSHRTLPGLIAEIMAEGRRMTYEELCNAVLPHWKNLRKHNGEKYAYSSHSQAVLDCLRNRTEWARLVDRGPKTTASRKKRKTDADLPRTESEDGEDGKFKDGETKSLESNREGFPKGRRRARNGRRLALQGRATEGNRKRRKIEGGSDGTDSFSNSGEDSVSSDDESRGSGMSGSRKEVSASSDEAATVT